ncbi:kinase-like domain-containing protein [Coniochaeta sp. 2T2.1]|nr:kinase-like domain-containing protein [Coniochaeta sp. 2T2.1]
MAGRVRHPIDTAKLESYINAHVPEIVCPLDIKQFGFGQSNPTYQLTSIPTGKKYVLRKKPPGKLVSKTAHKVEREHRIIAALGASPVPVPKAYILCEDESIVGTPFYIMSFLDGRIIEDAAMPGLSATERRQLWNEAVRTLALLHSVDPDSVGLGNFGKRNGFYNRQIQTWSTICAAQAGTKDVDSGEPVGVLPHFEETIRFFADEKRQPLDRGTLIHGDYKIDNLVFHKTEPRVIGILDWEMSTIGHPLSDLANMLTPFYTAPLDATKVQNSHKGFLPGATPGLPTPEEIAELYFSTVAQQTAGSKSKAIKVTEDKKERERELQWAQAFNIFRQAAICQGIAARQASRQASSDMAARYANARAPLAEFAWELVQGVQGSKPRL